MDCRACASLDGYGGHSSKTMTTSESSAVCTCMEISGLRNTASPFTGDRKRTPSSESLRNSARLNTWNPPESVRIGPGQCMKPCSPPCARITSVPGRSIR